MIFIFVCSITCSSTIRLLAKFGMNSSRCEPALSVMCWYLVGKGTAGVALVAVMHVESPAMCQKHDVLNHERYIDLELI